MDSMKEVYEAVVAHEKTASAAGEAGGDAGSVTDEDAAMYKKAEDYEMVGRIMARQIYADLVKEAMPFGHGPGHKHEDTDDECPPHCEHHKKSDDKEDDKGKEEEIEEALEAKHASVKAEILQRMAQDPAYAAEIFAKHASKLAAK